MSDDIHRPTLTFPTGAYNATQVRLYGIAAGGALVYPESPHSIAGAGMNVSVNMTSSDQDHSNNQTIADQLAKLRKKHATDSGPPSDVELFAGIVRGSIPFPDLPLGFASQVSLDIKRLGTAAISVSITLAEAIDKQKGMSCGIIVGYSYEGHTYDLPKPKIMIIPAFPEPRIPKDDSGFDLKEPEGYAVWIVDKLDECVEFEMNQGFIEQLVLEANLPGKRAPNMYAGRMLLSHRSGRLAE